ncbi:MAG: hypothetical protein BWX84_00228 [Verrucomicrobia bacterium ADurb.Bin118]|nr:MAG: hypothetical protein BWX84_00228 [Verrucomicrobia bacterium ADurb.Bin118]
MVFGAANLGGTALDALGGDRQSQAALGQMGVGMLSGFTAADGGHSMAYRFGYTFVNVASVVGVGEATLSRLSLGAADDVARLRMLHPRLDPAEAGMLNLSRDAAKGAGQTTILGENMAQRVMPFAEQTGARTLGFGSTADEWAAMTAQQRYKLNDGMLRARINEGDSFRYIGQDPLRNPALRTQFDLTGSELLRLNSRGIPYETVSPSEVMSVLGRP